MFEPIGRNILSLVRLFLYRGGAAEAPGAKPRFFWTGVDLKAPPVHSRPIRALLATNSLAASRSPIVTGRMSPEPQNWSYTIRKDLNSVAAYVLHFHTCEGAVSPYRAPIHVIIERRDQSLPPSFSLHLALVVRFCAPKRDFETDTEGSEMRGMILWRYCGTGQVRSQHGFRLPLRPWPKVGPRCIFLGASYERSLLSNCEPEFQQECSPRPLGRYYISVLCKEGGGCIWFQAHRKPKSTRINLESHL
ncbi:uncharacterized protein BDZ99DRAFT_533410 [Mytilinidion resinicola]|uniref:Uncharacterized protein n=1 Tax=Mytilinidion resinicola TaxID=574789 RepID=A0A6A6YM25_9PEZI|nr:uncharacterized protein BDZ99DRAFT_533410 [Mytilinidion resinicola]KAF2809034.1 hypothetical protein BDZ99DRAFT_533410 [Mytilinidion resinicola]